MQHMPAAADQPLPTATGKLKAGSHRRKRREKGKLTVATVTSAMAIKWEELKRKGEESWRRKTEQRGRMKGEQRVCSGGFLK